MVRYYIIFKGRVQGVGFRWHMGMICEKYHISGWVRNLDNGDVDAEIQGESEDIDKLLKDLFNIKGYIRIDDYSLKKIAIKLSDGNFRTIY